MIKIDKDIEFLNLNNSALDEIPKEVFSLTNLKKTSFMWE